MFYSKADIDRIVDRFSSFPWTRDIKVLFFDWGSQIVVSCKIVSVFLPAGHRAGWRALADKEASFIIGDSDKLLSDAENCYLTAVGKEVALIARLTRRLKRPLNEHEILAQCYFPKLHRLSILWISP
mgnify:CR=1 FL=1